MMIRKKTWALALALCVTLAGFGAFYAHSTAKEQSMAEIREKVIKEFKRGGMSTTPEDAMMLRILIESARLKRGIEVGSYHGYGAINMGIAFERTGGHLTTVEIAPANATKCKENLKTTGLDKIVTSIEGDALEVLPKLEGEYDFLFIDALKQDYLKYFKCVEAKLKLGAVIVADNSIRHAEAMKDYLDYVNNSPDYDTVTISCSLEKGDGMTISYKIK